MANAEEIKRNAPAGSIISKLSAERIQELLDKEAAADKRNENTRMIATRQRIKASLMIAKAHKAGITVTKAEVEAEIKARGL